MLFNAIYNLLSLFEYFYDLDDFFFQPHFLLVLFVCLFVLLLVWHPAPGLGCDWY